MFLLRLAQCPAHLTAKDSAPSKLCLSANHGSPFLPFPSLQRSAETKHIRTLLLDNEARTNHTSLDLSLTSCLCTSYHAPLLFFTRLLHFNTHLPLPSQCPWLDLPLFLRVAQQAGLTWDRERPTTDPAFPFVHQALGCISSPWHRRLSTQNIFSHKLRPFPVSASDATSSSDRSGFHSDDETKPLATFTLPVLQCVTLPGHPCAVLFSPSDSATIPPCLETRSPPDRSDQDRLPLSSYHASSLYHGWE